MEKLSKELTYTIVQDTIKYLNEKKDLLLDKIVIDDNFKIMYPFMYLGKLAHKSFEAPNMYSNALSVFSFYISEVLKRNKEIKIIKTTNNGYNLFVQSIPEIIELVEIIKICLELNQFDDRIRPIALKEGNKVSLIIPEISHFRGKKPSISEEIYFSNTQFSEYFERKKELSLEAVILSSLSTNEEGFVQEIYNLSREIVSTDLDLFPGEFSSRVIETKEYLIDVIAYLYYLALRVSAKNMSDILDKDTVYSYPIVIDYNGLIDDLVGITRLKRKYIESIVNYFINDSGDFGLAEFPLYRVQDYIVTCPSLIILNDWHITVVNGHYYKGLHINNRDKVVSNEIEIRIEEKIKNCDNIIYKINYPYNFIDDGEKINGEMDFLIMDPNNNIILVIETKWIMNHYKDGYVVLYQKVMNTFKKIFDEQMSRNKRFLSDINNLNKIFSEQHTYFNIKEEKDYEIVCIGVDKRTQFHDDDKHLFTLYNFLDLLNDFIDCNKLDIKGLCNEITKFKTVVDYDNSNKKLLEIKSENQAINLYYN